MTAIPLYVCAKVPVGTGGFAIKGELCPFCKTPIAKHRELDVGAKAA